MSTIIFDSRHGVSATIADIPSRDRLLASALQSRAGTLQLYDYIAESTLDCSIAMNLQDTDTAYAHDSAPPHLSYQIHARTSEDPLHFQKMIVENIPASALDELGKRDILEPDAPEIELFKPTTEPTIIRVEKHGSTSPCFLRLPANPSATITMNAPLKSLASLLSPPSTSTSNDPAHLSLGAKIDLAYKVALSAFYLLGTPIFYLSSRNINLLSNHPNPHKQTPILQIQTLDYSDLLFEDPTALSEASQLFRIGVLLMEIALDTPLLPSHGMEDRGPEIEWRRRLPEVERVMGGEYCKATAYCLLYREPDKRFLNEKKYSGERFEEWEVYLKGLLRDFHAQVLVRLANSRCS